MCNEQTERLEILRVNTIVLGQGINHLSSALEQLRLADECLSKFQE